MVMMIKNKRPSVRFLLLVSIAIRVYHHLKSKWFFCQNMPSGYIITFFVFARGYDVCLFRGVSPCYDVSPCYVVTNRVKGGIKYRTQVLKDLLISSILYFTDILRLPHSPIFSSDITTNLHDSSVLQFFKSSEEHASYKGPANE